MTTDARKFGTRRRFARVPISGTVRYWLGAHVQGIANLADVGLSGLSIVHERELLPGQRILLKTTSPGDDVPGIELKGIVAWCGPAERDGKFRAGIRIYCTDESIALGMRTLVQSGFRKHWVLDVRAITDTFSRSGVRTGRETIDASTFWFGEEPLETPLKHAAAVG